MKVGKVIVYRYLPKESKLMASLARKVVFVDGCRFLSFLIHHFLFTFSLFNPFTITNDLLLLQTQTNRIPFTMANTAYKKLIAVDLARMSLKVIDA